RLVRAALVGCAVSSIAPSLAVANGRFPLANQLVVDPVNPKHMVAGATFGILDTYDGGATGAGGFGDAARLVRRGGAATAVTPNGNTLVASAIGLSTSPDGGCSWTKRTVGTERRSGVDLAINPMNPHEALALESLSLDGMYSVSMVKTSDDGATWTE